MQIYRDTYAQIDLDAFDNNIKYLKSLDNKELIAVIKANGYGHGASMIAKEAIECGASMLAVSSLDEAIALRNDHIDDPILILGYTDSQDIEVAINYDIIVSVPYLKWVEEIDSTKLKGQLKVHLQVDTAMNRLGMKEISEINNAIKLLSEKNIIIDGIYTHYACSDLDDNEFTNQQFLKFKAMVEATHFDFHYIHAANSDASIHFSEDFTNAKRVGLAMYGITSYDSVLKPILALYSSLSNVKKVNKGEGIGYSQTYHTMEDEWIATVPIGYGDGIIRRNQSHIVYVENEPCEIVGRICMDQCMIRLPREMALRSKVEFIGSNISAMDLAKILDTIPYEILCLISDRVPRIYVKNKKVMSVDNPRIHSFEHPF